MPIITVIIPTFNRASVLTRALESVASQDFTDWELLIADDGSTDNTAEIAREFIQRTGRAHYLPSPQNLGVSATRNRAARLARGSWLAFLDSDDEWLPNKLFVQMQLASEFSLIHGAEIWIRNGVRVNQRKKHAKSGGEVFRACVDQCFISPSTVLIRRDLFERLGGFREDFPVCEDYDLWLRIAAHLPVGFIAEPLIMKYGGHADQLSTTFKAMDYYRAKALAPFLNERGLSPADRHYVAAALLAKCEILLNGYSKHGNLKNYAEVEGWLRKARTAVHSAHSTADLRPRSESSLIL